MKKLLNLFAITAFAVCCILCMSASKAFAADEMNVIYACVPADWENPCVWAWDDDGVGAFSAWPGGAMEADANNEGWFYIYVPASMTNVIINANEGSVQTADMPTCGMNAWVTVNSAEDATLTNEKLTDGDIPAYVSKFTVYAKVDETWAEPCLWAWSAPDGTGLFSAWPGEALQANPDGFYSYEVPEWINSIIINANAGGIQTSDISVEAKDLWLLVDAEGNFDLFYEKPEASADELITVHAKVPSDWLMPSLWAWSAPDGTNVFANWPGQELNLTGDWYTYSIPNWVNSVIVNGNLGTVQTTDVSIEKGNDIWLIIEGAEEYYLFYSEPSDEDIANAKASATNEDASEASQEETESNVIETKVTTTDNTEKSTNADTEKEEKTSNAGLIAGICAGVVAIGVGTGVVIKKKKKSA